MKIVLDTNIIVSGIFFAGIPGKILELLDSPYFEVFASDEIVNEYSQTVFRISINRNQLIAQKFLEKILSILIINNPKTHSSKCRDIKDNMFIDCAVENKADYLITGDNDLLVLNQIERVKIIRPADFLCLLLDS